jgi:transcriptional regulator with XRE-family HTH domain
VKSPAGRTAQGFDIVRARNFRRLREGAAMPQVVLARKLGMAHTYIVSMESGGRPITLRTIDKLAPVLGMTPAQVLAELDAPVAAEVAA